MLPLLLFGAAAILLLTGMAGPSGLGFAPGYAQAIFDAVNALSPASNPIYQPGYGGAGFTWCNKFIYDLLSQLDIGIPFVLENDQYDFLAESNDWSQVSGNQAAIDAAMAGNIVLAAWKNTAAGGHGHIAIVLPVDDGSGVPTIAQAGATNCNSCSLYSGFSLFTPITFFVHA